ncbi:MAG: type I glutamate--ammonia ligase [Pseudomonadota bacterium]|nr:type I glutamate--ammonia ligase [Pseudomonadota bacterium]MEC8710759.1 type I glutamate--ammonia ligase [Pseudomonadota bacterium]
MTTYADIRKMIEENDVEYIDVRFTDPRGKLQHLAMCEHAMDEDAFNEGILFDGSSIAGWKAINESDMLLVPDMDTAVMDPFTAQPQLIIFCDVKDPITGEFYSRDPRGTAKKAEQFVKDSGVGTDVFFGPEAEFFMFDDVRFSVEMNRSFFEFYSEEGPYASGDEMEGGNMGHRPGVKGGYFPVNPIDQSGDIRAEMTSTLRAMGVDMDKHHHEVAPSQHELGMTFDHLTRVADKLQLYKYVVHNVAASYGKSATFMPKPVQGDNGTGMHCHQSIWKDGQPLFAGDKYAGLSQEALWYIGGVLKHAKALNAFTNPSTNSYKRLVPGFEAPVLLAYSARNRSASCRIPFGSSPKAKRMEIRFPDPTANPYLCFSAMLMAGLDGIKNKIDPGDPRDEDLYELSDEELKDIPTVCGSLREALDSLKADHDFLLEGGVFTKDQIEAYIDLKMEEVVEFEFAPHPVEFKMYYSV